MVFNKKFVPRILPAGVCDKAFSFSAAPTFLLTRHLQPLFQNSSDMRILSHPDALSSPENIETDSNRGFSIRLKRPHTQVRYTLPGEGYDYSVKRKIKNKSALPSKQLRRAILKRSSAGPRRKQKNFDLVACIGNILITNEEKGWRDCGAVIVLEVVDHNEWRLAIQLSGVTKYSHKVKQMLQPGSKNRYSHAILWKGGEDWLLEFDEKSQWNVFKEMYEECYNRNIRAASVKSVPIPGVKLIEESDDDQTEVPFVRHPRKYYRQFQTDAERAMDPCRVLYDIDSDDERWLMENEKCVAENKREGISEEFFEKTMDMFEKASYAQKRDKFTDDEVEELVNKTGSVEGAKAIYEYWQEKRRRKGMPLIRHLQYVLKLSSKKFVC